MDKLLWYINRLKAMELKEIFWRIDQKKIEFFERQRFNKTNIKSYDKINFYNSHLYLTNYKKYRINLNYENTEFSKEFVDEFWGNYKYKINGTYAWNSGFHYGKKWPNAFAYDISYKQKDEIGDARTNWEINRHHHLVQLAKLYFVTKDKKYLTELENAFYDWCDKNNFLNGIAWTSVMEVSIRAFSWIVILGFLEKSKDINYKFLEDLKKAILNSVEYTTNHYSRYSSANNHLVVEMVVIGITGIIFDIKEWINLANKTLEYEMKNQNYDDGVNKEQSPHYQTFVMESVMLFLLFCKRNNIYYNGELEQTLKKMCEYISDLSDISGEVANTGDSDEGKLLDISGTKFNHYKYVLELGSVLFEKKYTDLNKCNENIKWLFKENEILKIKEKYKNNRSKCYKNGGHSVLKYKENHKERIMTVDHAELGFGSIAAHGHADALSITLSIDGEKFFIDPGTYIYHIKKEWRDYFRRTINHNTICIGNKDQSEMKGAFLWGKRANCKLNKFATSETEDYLDVEHDGYRPNIHQRKIKYFKPDIYIIEDIVKNDFDYYELTYVLGDNIDINISENAIELKGKKNKVYLNFFKNEEIILDRVWNSETYSKKAETNALRIKNRKNNRIITIISINERVDKVESNGELLKFNYGKKNYQYKIDGGIEK